MRSKKSNKPKNCGWINGTLNIWNLSITKSLRNGFFGKFMSSYETIRSKAAEGVIFGGETRNPEGGEWSLRRMALKAHDESLLINRFQRLIFFLKLCPINVYGTYFGVFGLYSWIIFLIRTYFESGSIALTAIISESLICSWILMALSIPLLFIKRPLLDLVRESRILRLILTDAIGVSDEKFEIENERLQRGGYFGAILLGILTAAMTYFVSPLKIVIVMAALLLLSVLLVCPESGVIVTVFMAPFVSLSSHSVQILTVMVSTTAIAYLTKLAIGKRSFRLRLIDFFVCLLMILFFFGGVITSGGQASFDSAIRYVLLFFIYFLIVNLIKTPEWMDRLVGAIAIPAFCISAVGVIAHVLRFSRIAPWIQKLFDGADTISLFEMPNMLGTYLIMTMPFLWLYVKRKETTGSGRALTFIGSALSLMCLGLTCSRGAWIGGFAGLIVFLMINYRYALKYIAIVLVATPIGMLFIPKGKIFTQIAGITNLTDSVVYHRLFTWRGAFRMLSEYYAGGIGVGESALMQIYPLYSYIGAEATTHCYSLFLEIAVELGVMGLVVLLITLLMFYQKGFGFIKSTSNKDNVLLVSVGIAGITSALVHGLIYYIWYNYQVFFMFWTIVALVNVFIDSQRSTKIPVRLPSQQDDVKEASLDIIFGND